MVIEQILPARFCSRNKWCGSGEFPHWPATIRDSGSPPTTPSKPRCRSPCFGMRCAGVWDLVLSFIIHCVPLSGYLISLTLYKLVTIRPICSRTIDKKQLPPSSNFRWDLTEWTGNYGLQHPESMNHLMKYIAIDMRMCELHSQWATEFHSNICTFI